MASRFVKDAGVSTVHAQLTQLALKERRRKAGTSKLTDSL